MDPPLLDPAKHDAFSAHGSSLGTMSLPGCHLATRNSCCNAWFAEADADRKKHAICMSTHEDEGNIAHPHRSCVGTLGIYLAVSKAASGLALRCISIQRPAANCMTLPPTHCHMQVAGIACQVGLDLASACGQTHPPLPGHCHILLSAEPS